MITDTLVSRDGTRIGYRRTGDGPGLILLHGGMQSSQSFTRLAAALSDTFTVYTPDRRGRGISGPFGHGYGIRTEVEDVGALLEKTGSHNVFGLSSGAIITLQAALTLPSIRRIALYEPPLEIGRQPSPLDWVPRYEKELSAGNLPAAMTAIVKGTGDRSLFTSLPRFVLNSVFRLGMRLHPDHGDQNKPSLQALIPTVHFDTRLVAETAERLENFKAIQIETLLLGGSKSAFYLIAALDALATVLPNCKRIEFPGLGHTAADDTGEPKRVADALKRFFCNPDLGPNASSTA